MRILFIFLILFPIFASAQKMVILERANRAKTKKYYVGESLRFRYFGEEEYWYTRPITDVMPEKQLIFLGEQPVGIGEIGYLKVRRHPVWQTLGILGFSYGITMAFANTISFLRKDPDPHGLLYATAAGGLGMGWYLTSPRTLKLGKKHRLRAAEIRFER